MPDLHYTFPNVPNNRFNYPLTTNVLKLFYWYLRRSLKKKLASIIEYCNDWSVWILFLLLYIVSNLWFLAMNVQYQTHSDQPSKTTAEDGLSLPKLRNKQPHAIVKNSWKEKFLKCVLYIFCILIDLFGWASFYCTGFTEPHLVRVCYGLLNLHPGLEKAFIFPHFMQIKTTQPVWKQPDYKHRKETKSRKESLHKLLQNTG